MALRFRKSIKLAPGVRWNISGSGSSWTVGPRGSSVSIGKRGTFLNSGIPGTGFSSRQRLSGGDALKSPRLSATPAATTSVTMTCGIRDDGTVFFVDASGAAMSEHVVELAKKQNREAIQGLIQRKCDEINGQVEALGRLHHDTPDSRIKPRFAAPVFSEPEPRMPQPQQPGFFDKLLKSRARKIDESNRDADLRYQADMADWRRDKSDFDHKVAERRKLVETLIYQDVSAMEGFLEESLQDIAWPRETAVALDIRDGGARVLLDVDLPELEDMPQTLAAVPSRGLKLSVKELSKTRVQRLYAEHAHGILFRLVGEVFAALPKTQTVVASGYSQRRDPGTAQMRNDYLLSVRVQRLEWEVTDFQHLGAIDVTEALSRYDLRREMLKSGMLRAIEPHAQ